MIKKIVITGPESSGKTTLARQLAQVLSTSWVPEYARTFIDQLERPYEEHDLLKIAEGQLGSEDEQASKAKEFLICDTDLLTIKIWSEYRYQRCDQAILEMIDQRYYDAYLLVHPDIPWTFDPQRENPNDRNQLFLLYQQNLDFYKKRYFEIKGTVPMRLKMALQYLSTLS